jgi:hypothetical protein
MLTPSSVTIGPIEQFRLLIQINALHLEWPDDCGHKTREAMEKTIHDKFAF